MEKSEAEFYFHEADRLFKEEHYLEALQHLAALDNAFPGTFNVLFPMALCCEQLGRIDEAYERCARMFEQFPGGKQQTKLQELYGRVCRQQQARTVTGEQIPAPFSAHDFIEDTPTHTELKRTGTMALGNWELPWANILIGLSVLAVFFILLSLLVPMAREGISEQSPQILYWGIALIVLVQFLLSCIITYAVLWVMNKRIHEEFIPDAIDVCIAMGIYMLISGIIPVIGSLVGLYFLAKHYEMGFGEAIIFLLLQFVFHLLFLYMVLSVIFG